MELANLFEGRIKPFARNTAFGVEGYNYDDDCVILEGSSDQRNTPELHSFELSNDETRVSESSDSSKVYVENSITVTVNSLSKFYIDLKVHILYPACFLIDSGSTVNTLIKETFLKISKQSPELKLNQRKIKLISYGQAIPSIKTMEYISIPIYYENKKVDGYV